MWFRIIKTKYMSEGCFLNLVPRVAHNFGKGFIRSNICLSGGPSFRLGMVPIANFGKTAGYCRCL